MKGAISSWQSWDKTKIQVSQSENCRCKLIYPIFLHFVFGYTTVSPLLMWQQIILMSTKCFEWKAHGLILKPEKCRGSGLSAPTPISPSVFFPFGAASSGMLFHVLSQEVPIHRQHLFRRCCMAPSSSAATGNWLFPSELSSQTVVKLCWSLQSCV